MANKNHLSAEDSKVLVDEKGINVNRPDGAVWVQDGIVEDDD